MKIQAAEYKAMFFAPLAAGPSLFLSAAIIHPDFLLDTKLLVILILPFYNLLLIAPYSYIGMLVFGIPTYIILRKFGLFKTWLVSVLGALYGFGVIFFLFRFEIKTDFNAEIMVHFAICGFVVAFVASVIVNREYKSNKSN